MSDVKKYFSTILTAILLLAGCDGGNKTTVSAERGEQQPQTVNVEQVLVPAGEFIRGSNREDDLAMRQQYGFPAPLFVDEHPQKKIYLDDFKIDTYEVSNKQFKDYIIRARRMLPYAWMSNGYAIAEEQLNMLEVEKLRKMAIDVFAVDLDTRKMDKPALLAAMLTQQQAQDNYPVTGVNWFAAKEYCAWRDARLPSEAEWEKAARGANGFEYPWGNEWDPRITNTGDDGEWDEGMAPVGVYPKNKSPYGAFDMSGNVWEWVADWYAPYEGSTYAAKAFGKTKRVIRGGGGGVGHYAISYFFRGATRQFAEPEMESEDVGFRCVSDI
jgi:formylglycine-generating enzyme required for sulfatase activity